MFTISQVLSPLLPAVLVIGQSVASERLRKKKIICTDLQRVTLGGKVKIFCFDKTGTLTKEGLDFRGIQAVNSDGLSFQNVDTVYRNFPKQIRSAMETAHSLQTVNSEFVGNFVDKEMFKSTEARLVYDQEKGRNVIYPSNEPCISILKRFEFVHSNAYMSVAVLNEIDSSVDVYLKGSFEKIKEVVEQDSIPFNYDQIAQLHSSQGCYVLALAHKSFDSSISILKVNSMDRAKLESGSRFIGFMLFRNELKDDTFEALAHLKDGGCRNVMITGDNINTACYIARKSGMIKDEEIVLADVDSAGNVFWTGLDDQTSYSSVELEKAINSSRRSSGSFELAVSGKAFNVLMADGFMRRFLLNTRIFARFSPIDKSNCVRLHMERGITAMCGDGGNDAGALKAAHCGIALSEAESSVVSHFSSSNRSIFACVDLLLECRCSLDVSFACKLY